LILDDLNYGGNGDYGLETMMWTNTLTRRTISIDSAIVAGINDTHYYEGFIGLGIGQSNFSNTITKSFVMQLAQVYGTVPSYSYGYTAGAYYSKL
jgi:hypothetical protein